MAKIPFSIEHREKIESGEYKVETQDGRTVRIICWDRKGNDYPMLALLEEESGMENLLSYTQNGKHVKGLSNVPSDLFIITPAPELTEFENELATVIGFAISQSVVSPEEKLQDFVKGWSERLLTLARKQLQPEINAEIEKAYKTADEVMYRKGKEDGIAEARNDISTRIIALKISKERAEEALKDLPRWSPSTGCFDDGWINVGILYYKFHAIPLKTLEELPGFKEDER